MKLGLKFVRNALSQLRKKNSNNTIATAMDLLRVKSTLIIQSTVQGTLAMYRKTVKYQVHSNMQPIRTLLSILVVPLLFQVIDLLTVKK